MADVAVLGLAIDSRPVTTAVDALGKLAPAAKAAEAATVGLTAASVKGAPAHGALANAAKAAAGAHAGMSTQAMSAMHSIRSMSEQIAMGIPVTQILAQQMNHLSYAATGPGGIKGAFGEALGALKGLLSPTTLLIGGLAAVAGAAYLANKAWEESALALDDTARAAGATITQLHELETLAQGKGLDGAGFLKASGQFAANIYQAKNNAGSLADVLRVNGERATDFAGTLGSAADIINRATSDQQKLQLLQQMGLPATMQWVRFMSQGGDAIREAANDTGSQVSKLQELTDKARQFDEAMSSAWAHFKSGAFDAMTSAKAGLSDLVGWWQDKMGTLVGPSEIFKATAAAGGGSRLTQSAANDFYRATGAGQPAGSKSTTPARDPAAMRKQISDAQQYLGLLGQTATATEQVRQFNLSLQAAAINGIGIDAKRAQILRDNIRDQALGVTAIKQQTDAYNVESATVGMSIEKATAFAAAQNAINDARRRGQSLSASEIDYINQNADALGRAAAKADELKFEYDTFSGTMRDFQSNLRSGQTVWQAFGNAGANALGKIADRLSDMASKALWQAAFPSGSGGILGLLGLGGGGGELPGFGTSSFVGPLPSANGNVFSSAGLSAYSGTVVSRPTLFPINDGPIRAFANGAGLMGEAGPEGIFPLTRIGGKLGVRAAGGSQPISVTVAPVYTFHNADPSVEARLTQQIKQSSQKTKEDTIAAVNKLKRDAAGSYLQ